MVAPYLQPDTALQHRCRGAALPKPPQLLCSAVLGATHLAVRGCGAQLSEQRGWGHWGALWRSPCSGCWVLVLRFGDTHMTTRSKGSRDSPLSSPGPGVLVLLGTRCCWQLCHLLPGSGHAAPVTQRGQQGWDTSHPRAGSAVATQYCLSGSPSTQPRWGLIASLQVASRNATVSLPCQHKQHNGTVLAAGCDPGGDTQSWGHVWAEPCMGRWHAKPGTAWLFGDTHGQGPRMGAVMHTEVTQPSWGHMDPSLGVACVSQGHTGHQFAMGSSQSGMKDWGGDPTGSLGPPLSSCPPQAELCGMAQSCWILPPPSSPLGTKGL